MAFAKKFFRVREKTPFGFCDGPQTTISEFLFGECPNYPKYHTTYRPVGQIHRVAAEGDAGRIEVLIMLGQCSVFDRDHKNRTALHFACVYGRLPVVHVLLKNNSEIDALDQNQITPLMKSVQCWKQKCAAVLLEHGADPNIRDSRGNCSLHYAVYNGHEDMAALLLEYHADIEQKTKDGFTPLLLALREKRVEVAEFLVKKGADIHVVDDKQRNTLMYAIRCESKDIAMLLLQKGIDFFYKDVFGWTALRYAIEGHCTFRQMLLDFEGNIHNNKKDNEPVEQMDPGNDSLARISGCSSPRLPLPVVKEDTCSCDTRVKCPSVECTSLPQSISESAPLSHAGSLSSAIDKIFENTAKRKVKAWTEKDLSLKSATEGRESVATEVREFVATEVRESLATEVRGSVATEVGDVTNEVAERTELLPFLPEPELELISVEEDIPDESENNQPLSIVEHLPQKNVGCLSGTGYEMGKININEQMKESDKELSQMTTPIEIKNDDFKEAWTTKDTPAFKSEPDLEVTSEEDHSRFDEKGSIHSLLFGRTACNRNVVNSDRGITENFSIDENLPNISDNESVGADSRREKTNGQATESEEEYSPLMVINEMNDSVLNKAVEMKEAWSIQDDLSEGPAVKLTSEEESDSYDGFEKNPPLNIIKQIHTQGVDYLSLAKDQKEEKMVMCQEKEFSKECPQSKPTIVKQESVPKEAWDMSPVIQLLADTPKDYPLSKTTVEENDSVPNEVCDAKHGKWFLVESPDEYIQVKVFPIEGRDSYEAPATQQVNSYCSAEPTIKVSGEEWCGDRNFQRQGIDDLSLTEDERSKSTRLDEEQDSLEEYTQLKPVQKKKTPLPCEAPARKEIKAFGSESDVHSLSEEEQERPDDSAGEHLKDPQPMGTAHLSMAEDESGVNVVSDQEKDLPSEYPELKDAMEKQDLVLMEDSTMKQEKLLTEDAKTAQLRSEEEQTGWCGSGKKQWKSFFEQLQLKWNVRVSVNPKIHAKKAAEEKGVTTVQLRRKKEQTGRFGSDKKQRKPIFKRLQSKWCAQMSMDPEESRENSGAAEEKGATTVQLRPEEEQTKCNGCNKKQRKPIFERFQPKWSARVSVGPEESRENTGATGEKAESPKLLTSEEQTGCPDSEKKPQSHILERFQPKWSVRVCVDTEEGDNPEATETTCKSGSSDEYTELKSMQATTENQDSVATKDSTMKQEISFTAESDSETASGDDQNKCCSSESNQSLVEKTKTCASNGIDIAKYPCEAAVFTSPATAAAAAAGGGGGDSGGDTAAAGSGDAAAASADGGGTSAAASDGDATPAAAAVVVILLMLLVVMLLLLVLVLSLLQLLLLAAAAAAVSGGTDAAAGGIADFTMDELVLQRKSGEINDQRFLIKESAKHDGPRKKTSKEEHKVTKEGRAMADVTQASEPISEDDSGGSLKIQDSPNSYSALLELKKIHELFRKKNQKLENEIIALQKELIERREEKLKLEDEIMEQDEEFRTLRFTLCEEFKETRIIHKNIKKYLHEKQKQLNERVAMTELERHLGEQDMELRRARAILKELQEAKSQHIETLKIVQKMKDHLQRIEQENFELKVEVKEQTKKIEELRECLQNSPLKLEQNRTLTKAGTQETLEELCENISLMNQTGIRIQSLWSESSKTKTGKDSNTSAQKSYEKQRIEELRISNALLHKTRRLDKSRTQVHITVEQDTSHLHTSEARFSLENPYMANSCPRRHFFPCGNMVPPGNPRSSNDCMRSYPVTMEDEEKLIKVLIKLKGSLEYNLYQQQKTNNELEKEITRNKKLLKMAKIEHEIGECSSPGNSKTGHF
uniref:ankyrin repeat domain-containing protein 30B-like n=1 Tax=Myodes glareolus TaxID=447135 RepID=UPI002020DCB7|nr:ankyrin repeat domain-containing protein 30B-like [Myodes glareolus]